MFTTNTTLKKHVILAGRLESSHREVTHRIAMPSMDAGFRPPCRNDALRKIRLLRVNTVRTTLQKHVIPAGRLETSHKEVTHCITMPSMDAGFRIPCRNDALINKGQN